MIQSIEFLGQDGFCPWWKDIKYFETNKKITFTPGVNVIWGRNGSGKSTLITTLGKYFLAEQGGITTITKDALCNVKEIGRDDYHFDAYKIEHNGKPVLFNNSNHEVGLNKAGQFDDDFFLEGVKAATRKCSSGQKTLYKLNNLMNKEDKIEYKIDKKLCNSTWVEKIERCEEALKANIEHKNKTVLMDEPDNSLDLDNQIIFWEQMQIAANRGLIQIIIASHSLFALNMKNVNFIEFSPGYLKSSNEIFDNLKKG